MRQTLQDANGSLDRAIDVLLTLPPPEDAPTSSALAESAFANDGVPHVGPLHEGWSGGGGHDAAGAGACGAGRPRGGEGERTGRAATQEEEDEELATMLGMLLSNPTGPAADSGLLPPQAFYPSAHAQPAPESLPPTQPFAAGDPFASHGAWGHLGGGVGLEEADGFQTVRRGNSGGRRGGRGGGLGGGWGPGGSGGSAGAGVRVVVLVGMPGSGKSTLSQRFRDRGWLIVSQDELGDRRKCENAVHVALQNGERVVVDRTNIDASQRAHWLRIARENRLPPAAVVAVLLEVHVQTAKDRVMHRAQHPTLKAERSSMGIIDGFARDLVRPTEGEGFGRVIVLPEGFSLWSPEIVELAG